MNQGLKQQLVLIARVSQLFNISWDQKIKGKKAQNRNRNVTKDLSQKFYLRLKLIPISEKIMRWNLLLL